MAAAPNPNQPQDATGAATPARAAASSSSASQRRGQGGGQDAEEVQRLGRLLLPRDGVRSRRGCVHLWRGVRWRCGGAAGDEEEEEDDAGDGDGGAPGGELGKDPAGRCGSGFPPETTLEPRAAVEAFVQGAWCKGEVLRRVEHTDRYVVKVGSKKRMATAQPETME